MFNTKTKTQTNKNSYTSASSFFLHIIGSINQQPQQQQQYKHFLKQNIIKEKRKTREKMLRILSLGLMALMAISATQVQVSHNFNIFFLVFCFFFPFFQQQ